MTTGEKTGIQPKVDRRARRSSKPQNALDYLMESIMERFGLLGLVLSDDQGLVVAASSPLVDAEEMAAVSPLLRRDLPVEKPQGWPITVWPVKTRLGDLSLCAIGERTTVGAATLCAARSVRRILDETLS